SKLRALLASLEEVVADQHRVIVFSQFTSHLARIAEELRERGIQHSYLDGTTRERRGAVEAFRGGNAPVFLISLKAGGFGLTLTEADYVFLLDPWWNPAAESQAIDRTHRIGQTRRVMVYRLVAENTIEEKVLALQQQKDELCTALMDDGKACIEGISAADIQGRLDGRVAAAEAPPAAEELAVRRRCPCRLCEKGRVNAGDRRRRALRGSAAATAATFVALAF